MHISVPKTFSSFFFIKDRELYVRPVSNDILHGITRQTMLRVAETHQLKIREELYTLDQVLQADEAFITAASIYVLPVGRIDDTVIGNGETGTVTAANNNSKPPPPRPATTTAAKLRSKRRRQRSAGC